MSGPFDSIATVHTSVLLKESIDGLFVQKGDVYLDGTLGGGGHAAYALEKTHGDLTVIGLDRDLDALARSKKVLEKYHPRELHLKQSSFADLDHVLDVLKIEKVNRIMLDLGLSSDQFEISGRGFSIKRPDEPLLMTFDKHPAEDDLTARYILNKWEETTIADIIFGYGEERYSRLIARAVISYRKKKQIETVGELVEIVQSAVPASYRRGRIHPATKTFQALRITVNDELNTLKSGLEKGWGRLAPKGRMAVISFHSLEDRIVKHFFKGKAESSEGVIITKRPIEASEEEVQKNPRSRSAKLRLIEKI